MKYVLRGAPLLTWNGQRELPREIHTLQNAPKLSEFELLAAICGLHGYVCAMDVLTGAEKGTEKDADLDAVFCAFEAYLSPQLPLSLYTSEDKRVQAHVRATPPNAVDGNTATKIDLNQSS